MEKYLTVREISKQVNLHPGTLRDWLRKGKIKGYRFGKAWRVKEVEFLAFITIFEEGNRV